MPKNERRMKNRFLKRGRLGAGSRLLIYEARLNKLMARHKIDINDPERWEKLTLELAILHEDDFEDLKSAGPGHPDKDAEDFLLFCQVIYRQAITPKDPATGKVPGIVPTGRALILNQISDSAIKSKFNKIKKKSYGMKATKDLEMFGPLWFENNYINTIDAWPSELVG